MGRWIGWLAAAAMLLTSAVASAEQPEGYGTFDGTNKYLKSGATGKGLVICGPIIFGTAWIASGVMNIFMDDGDAPGLSAIPVAGPFIAMGTWDVDSDEMAALSIGGLMQVGGLAMMTAGIYTLGWEVTPHTPHAGYGIAELRVDIGDSIKLTGSF